MSEERTYQTDEPPEEPVRETTREVTRETTVQSPPPQREVQYTAPPPPPPPAPRTGAYAPARHRPIGVTILAILGVIAGLFVLVSAIGSFALAGYFSMTTIPSDVQQQIPQWFLDIAPAFLIGTGIVMIIVAILLFAVAWGFITGRNWTRVLAIILLALGVIASILGFLGQVASGYFGVGSIGSLVLSIIIPVAIIWYLTTTHVKAWFIPGYRQGFESPGYYPSYGRR